MVPIGLRVSWTLPEAQCSVEVERATAEGGPYVRVTITAPGELWFDDSGLTPALTYWYRVRALRDGLASGYGGPASGTTPQVPAPPAPQGLAGVQEVANQQSTVRITWTDVPSETHYELQRSQNGTDWQPTLTLPTEAVSWIDLTPFFGTNHYRLRAVNAGGASAWSSVSIYAGPISIGYLCPPPSGSAAAALTETSARVTWTFDYLAHCGVAGIERAASAEGPFVELTRVFVPYIYPFPPLTSFTFDDAGLTPGTQFFYRVRHIAQSSRLEPLRVYAATVSVETPSSLSPPHRRHPARGLRHRGGVHLDRSLPPTRRASRSSSPTQRRGRSPRPSASPPTPRSPTRRACRPRPSTGSGSAPSAETSCRNLRRRFPSPLRRSWCCAPLPTSRCSRAPRSPPRNTTRIGNETNGVGCYFNWTNDLGGNIYLFHHCAASLLRFDAQPLVGKTVLGASLRMTPGGLAPGPLGDARYAVFALTAAWNPATISFNTLPPRHPDGWAVPAPTSAARRSST